MSAPAAAREEGRLHEGHDVMKVEQAGDQCTLGCNFDTKRPLRDILAIYKAVLGPVFGPTAYAGRLLRLAVMLDRSDRHCKLPDGDMRKRLGGIDSVHRIMRALPEVCEPFWKTFTADGAVHAPRAVLEALTAGLASWTVCLRRLWLGGGRAVNQILNVITYVLAAIYFLVMRSS